jgi:23S rRNA (guanosine2251-2'-O)-methyltransferase
LQERYIMKAHLIYGKHAVIEALKNKARRKTKLWLTSEAISELEASLLEICAVQIKSRKEIDVLVPSGSVHQGMILFCEPLSQPTLKDFLNRLKNMEEAGVVILDQVSDPQNIGAIMRSSLAFGAKAIIVQDKNAPEETASLVKAAAGTFEHLPMIREVNISRALEELKKVGFWSVGLDGYAEKELSSLPKIEKWALVMGSEGKGMRRLVSENCDFLARLPISEHVESLNVSVAAGVALYELSKK